MSRRGKQPVLKSSPCGKVAIGSPTTTSNRAAKYRRNQHSTAADQIPSATGALRCDPCAALRLSLLSDSLTYPVCVGAQTVLSTRLKSQGVLPNAQSVLQSVLPTAPESRRPAPRPQPRQLLQALQQPHPRRLTAEIGAPTAWTRPQRRAKAT